METKNYNDALINKVMEGLNTAVKKVIEDAAKNKESIVVSINGKIEHIYPELKS